MERLISFALALAIMLRATSSVIIKILSRESTCKYRSTIPDPSAEQHAVADPQGRKTLFRHPSPYIVALVGRWDFLTSLRSMSGSGQVHFKVPAAHHGALRAVGLQLANRENSAEEESGGSV